MARFLGRCCAGVGTYLAADTETQANIATAEAEAAASAVAEDIEDEVATEQSLNVGQPQHPNGATTGVVTTVAMPPKQDMRPYLIGGGLLLALLMLK